MARIFHGWADTNEVHHILGIYFQSIMGSTWNLPLPGMQEIIPAPRRPTARAISLAYSNVSLAYSLAQLPLLHLREKKERQDCWDGEFSLYHTPII